MPPETQARVLRFGLYEADLRSGELRKNGLKLRLQEQPFQVLAALLERPGEVVTREELRLRLWPADTFVDFDHSLNTAINKLREALGDSATNARFVETLARRGYRFIAPVQTVGPIEPAVAPEPALAPAAPQSAPSGTPPSIAAPAGVEVAEPELPQVHRAVSRLLLVLIQTMYLVFYAVALANLPAIGELGARAMGETGWRLLTVLALTAIVGIPVRLYLWTAVTFDYRRLGEKFRRLFPLLLPLDTLWALSPLLLTSHIGIGPALAATAALLYLPFSQRTLIRMSYQAA